MKSAVAEAERYNRNSSDTVDIDRLKQKIAEDSQMIQKMQELETARAIHCTNLRQYPKDYFVTGRKKLSYQTI